jgi:hypothetical protein
MYRNDNDVKVVSIRKKAEYMEKCKNIALAQKWKELENREKNIALCFCV